VCVCVYLTEFCLLTSHAGFNSTLRQGNVTHHEYIQVWFLISYLELF
jgi:hypothetical protein